MLHQRLQLAEFVLITASVIGLVVAAVSGQSIYWGIPVLGTLVLSLINRVRLEQRLRRRLNTAMDKLYRQLQHESNALLTQRLDEAISSFYAELPQYLSHLEATQPSTRTSLEQQASSREQRLGSLVYDLKSSLLTERVEQLEQAIALANQELTQMSQQLPNIWSSRFEQIEQQLHQIEQLSTAPKSNDGKGEPQHLAVEPQESTPDTIPPPTWNELYTRKEHSDWVRALVISPDGQRLASGSFDGTIKLWDLPTGKCLTTFSNGSQGVFCVAITPDGQTLVSGSFDGTIEVWCLSRQESLGCLREYTGSVRSLAITPDGQTLISGSFDGTVELWQLPYRKAITILSEAVGQVLALALTPDGQLLAGGGSDGAISLWQLPSALQDSQAAPKAILTGTISSVYSLATSPDGQMLAAGYADGSIKVWCLNTLTLLTVLNAHSAPVMSVVFSDVHRLISGSTDCTIKVWSLAREQPLAVFTTASSVMAIAISATSQWIAGGCEDGTVKVWQQMSQ